MQLHLLIPLISNSSNEIDHTLYYIRMKQRHNVFQFNF